MRLVGHLSLHAADRLPDVGHDPFALVVGCLAEHFLHCALGAVLAMSCLILVHDEIPVD